MNVHALIECSTGGLGFSPANQCDRATPLYILSSDVIPALHGWVLMLAWLNFFPVIWLWGLLRSQPERFLGHVKASQQKFPSRRQVPYARIWVHEGDIIGKKK